LQPKESLAPSSKRLQAHLNNQSRDHQTCATELHDIHDELDNGYNADGSETAALVKQLKEQAERQQADKEDKYITMANHLMRQFQGMDAKLNDAFMTGRDNTITVSTQVSRWQWAPGSPENEQTQLVKRILRADLEKRVKTPNVTLDAFCPQFDLQKGKIMCATQAGGAERPLSECMEQRCVVTATLMKGL